MLPENKCSIASDSLCCPKRNKLIQLHYSFTISAVGSVFISNAAANIVCKIVLFITVSVGTSKCFFKGYCREL